MDAADCPTSRSRSVASSPNRPFAHCASPRPSSIARRIRTCVGQLLLMRRLAVVHGESGSRVRWARCSPVIAFSRDWGGGGGPGRRRESALGLRFAASRQMLRGCMPRAAAGCLTSNSCTSGGGWIGTLSIEPGNPWENGYLESFSGKLRDECLNGELFLCLAETRWVVDRWRLDYNHHRPHSMLNWQTPAEFATRCRGRDRRRELCAAPGSAAPRPPQHTARQRP